MHESGISTWSWVAVFCIGTLLCRAQESSAEHELKLDLSPLLELPQIWAITEESVEKGFAAEGFSKNPYIRWSEDRTEVSFSRSPFTNVKVDLSAAKGSMKLEEVKLKLGGSGKVNRMEIKAESMAALETWLTERFGSAPQPGPLPTLGWKRHANNKTLTWSGAMGRAISQGAMAALEPPGDELIALPARAGNEGSAEDVSGLHFFVRVDELLRVPSLWSVSQDALEQLFKVDGVSVSKSPFYQWTTGNRDSARLSRHLFSNTTTDLLMFGDTVSVEEANVDFKSGRVAKLTVALLTRGNSGKIAGDKFDDVFKATGRALGALLGVRPQRTTPAGKALVKVDGWLWTTPHTLALLEYNAEAPTGSVEFLRLTMAPAAARAELLNLAGIGGNITTRRRDSLATSLKKDPVSGEVEIVGIPMRDQGQKGYCVAASCERLLRYLNVPCDMDEMARLVEADAERGASPSVMYESLTKIDQRYGMRAKLLKIPTGYGLGEATRRSELERAWKADLNKVVQEHINQGLPLLWCVLLPPGETGLPPGGSERSTALPDSGQRFGHMRLIIGYNAKSGEIIYSDSWGAGHERKVMSAAEAEEMTTAIFSMAPSR